VDSEQGAGIGSQGSQIMGQDVLPNRTVDIDYRFFILIAVFVDWPYRGGEFPIQDWSTSHAFRILSDANHNGSRTG
jgi:hypothetical protein